MMYVNSCSAFLAAQTLTPTQLVINSVAAIIFGITIFVCYGLSHSAESYSLKFNISLLLMTFVIAFITSETSNNFWLLAFSIIVISIIGVFKSVKNPKDTVYILWCAAAGFCCGVSQYFYLGFFCLLIFTIYFLIKSIHPPKVYLIKVRTEHKSIFRVRCLMERVFDDNACFCDKTETKNSCELIFRVPERAFKRRKNSQSIVEELYEIDSVSLVSVVCENDYLAEKD